MCEALRILMKDEIAEERAKGRYESVRKLMKNTGMSEATAMDALEFSDEEKVGYKKWVEGQGKEG